MRISDWSSDVCSSDLTGAEIAEHLRAAILPSETLINALSRRVSELPQVSALHAYDQKGYLWLATGSDAMPLDVAGNDTFRRLRDGQQIGRASCRESVCQYV